MALSLSICVFKINHGGESITSFNIENPENMAESFWEMPESNLYMVSIAKKKGPLREVKAGIAVLTSYNHLDKEFQDTLMALIRQNPVLKPMAERSNMTFFSSKLSVQGVIPNENELKRAFFNEYIKHSSAGNA